MAMDVVDFLIIGAGPTGLGAANRLQELGIRNYLILESNSHGGGFRQATKTVPASRGTWGGTFFFEISICQPIDR